MGRKKIIEKITTRIRPLPAGDLRDMSHPCHRGQLRQLARAIGEAMADEDFARDHPEIMQQSGRGK